MSEETTIQEGALSEEQTAALELQGANDAIAALRAQQAESNAILLSQCASLLDSSLAASKLPGASQKAVRKSFDVVPGTIAFDICRNTRSTAL